MLSANLLQHKLKRACGSTCNWVRFENDGMLMQRIILHTLRVGDIEFVSCSTSVYEALLMDWMRNLEAGIPGLLEDGIKLVVYTIEYNLIYKWLGNLIWVLAMERKGTV